METLGNNLFLPDSNSKADVIIVLGMSLWKRPVAKALELYRNDPSSIFIFTGGHNDTIGKTEAKAMAEEAQTLGIPAQKILIEPLATNTRENFLYSRELMEKNKLLTDNCRITIITISYHMKRALLTAQDIFPKHIIGTASYPSIHYADNAWQQSPRGHADVERELEKLETYFPQEKRA